MGRVIDFLLDARPGNLNSKLTDVLNGIGKRVGVQHVYLFVVSKHKQRASTVSLAASSSAVADQASVQQVPLSIFSSAIVQSMNSRQSLFIPSSRKEGHGVRLLRTLMQEANSSGLLLCPVHSKRSLVGIVALSHNYGKDHIDTQGCENIRLIGQLMIKSVKSNKRMARQLRRHRRWRRIADAACDFAILMGEQDRILQVLPFGDKDVPDLAGVTIDSILSGKSRRTLDRAICQSKEERSPVSCDLKVAWRIDQLLWFRVRVHAGHSDAQVMLYFTDIHEDRLQQEQLHDLEIALNRTYRLSLLGQVSTEFAHQINQPLQAITNYCGTMQLRLTNKSNTAANTKNSIKNILQSVDHATQILVRIREFVQFKSLTLEPCDLTAIAERAVMMAENRAIDLGVALHCRWQSERNRAEQNRGHQISECWCMIDEVQTTQILINLIVNAVEACEGQKRPKPKVELDIDLDDDPRWWLIRVIDNGPGLPQENPEQVFEKFHTTKAEGLGIGLAVSRSVAEAQSGSLTAANNDDKGCTFFLRVRKVSKPGSETDEMDVIPADQLMID